jgi:MFS-type transporter involved in bile tolerance (Atg22 family)
LILSINRFIRLLSNGPAGWMFDRLPDRRTLFLGSLWLGVLSTALYASSVGLQPLFLARLLWGLAWSGIWIGGNAIVLEMAPEDQRGRWVGIYQVWFFFGSALGSFVGGALTDAVGYHHALGLGALISAAGALAATAALGVARTPARVNASIGARPPDEIRAAAAHRIRFSLPQWRAISPALGAASAAHAANRLVVSGVVSATLGLVVEQNLGTGLQWGAWQIRVASITGGILAARTLISLVGAPVAGAWSDTEGNRWHLLVWSLAAGALGIGLLAAPGVVPIIVGSFVGAAASGSATITLSNYRTIVLLHYPTIALTADLAGMGKCP